MPQPQGSKTSFGIYNKARQRVGTNTVEDNKKTKPWRADVKAYAQQNMGSAPLMQGPLVVEYRFVIYRPGLPKKTPIPTPLKFAAKKPDWDKLARAISDALTGTVYVDDSQVVEGHVYKRVAEVGEGTGAHIRVIKAL